MSRLRLRLRRLVCLVSTCRRGGVREEVDEDEEGNNLQVSNHTDTSDEFTTTTTETRPHALSLLTLHRWDWRALAPAASHPIFG